MTSKQFKNAEADYYNQEWGKRNKVPELIHMKLSRGKQAVFHGENTVVLMIQVFSQRMKGRIKQGEVNFEQMDSEAEMRTKATILSGALAERCCEDYGDTFDPSDVAKAGREVFDNLLHNIREGRLTQAGVMA